MINSKAERQALAPKVPERSWIGLRRNPRDKWSWLWIGGAQGTYPHWDIGEPNNLNGTEDCAEIYPAYLSPHAGYLNDRMCNVSLHYICEKNG